MAKECAYCGSRRDLGDDGTCKNKAECAERVTSSLLTKPFVGGFNPDKAYREAEKGK